VSLPLFPVTTVGSWPRPPRVAEALRAYRRRRIDRAEFDRIADDAVVDLLRLQETLGCDIVTTASCGATTSTRSSPGSCPVYG
jgi:5-methyltetrahydropteroyltriglutamate--homocysteine methyltransferase